EDDASVAPLEIQEAGHRRGERQRLGIGRVDASDHRLRDAIEHLLAEAAADEGREALVATRRRTAARRDGVLEGRERAAPGREGRKGGGGEKLEGVGQGDENAVAGDQRAAKAVVRR